MNLYDVIAAMGNTGKPIGSPDLLERIAREKGYGKIRKLLFCNQGALNRILLKCETLGLVRRETGSIPGPRPNTYSLTDKGREIYIIHQDLGM